MKFAKSLVIFSLFIVGIYAVKDAVELPPASVPSSGIPLAVDKKTTPTPAPTPTTEASSSTSSTTTPAPIEPTTTEAPTTPAAPTTTAPTTTSTSSTTTSTTTTTEAPKSTTVAPKPADPQIGRYFVEKDKKACILVEFAAQLNISYDNGQYKVYNVPGTVGNDFVNTTGFCGNETTAQYMLISWNENSDVNTLNLTFNLNTTTQPKEYTLSKAVFNLSASAIPGSTERMVIYHVGSFFETPKSRSYHCTRPQTLNLTVDTELKPELRGNVTLTHVAIEAYRSDENRKLSQAIDCDAINTPDIVPIAVGIALIALVVVVLIAYLVGRRRAQSRGYVSM